LSLEQLPQGISNCNTLDTFDKNSNTFLCYWDTTLTCWVHSVLEKSLKMLEFGINYFKALESAWKQIRCLKVLEFKSYKFWNSAFVDNLSLAFIITVLVSTVQYTSVSHCSLNCECPCLGYGFLSIILVIEKCNLGPWKSLKSAWILYFEFAMNPGLSSLNALATATSSLHSKLTQCCISGCIILSNIVCPLLWSSYRLSSMCMWDVT